MTNERRDFVPVLSAYPESLFSPSTLLSDYGELRIWD